MFFTAVIQQNHLVQLGTAIMANSRQDAEEKAANLLIDHGIQVNKRVRYQLENNQSYTSNGITVAIGELKTEWSELPKGA